jgi:hypothetical protein
MDEKKETGEGIKRSWILSGWVVTAIVLGLTIALALGTPPTPLKTVSVVYAPGADKAPLSVFVQPPLAVMEIDGKGQPVAIQFSNHTEATEAVSAVEALPLNCFQLTPQGGAVTLLAAHQTRVGLYDLRVVSGDCEGQRELTIHYPAAAASTAAAGEEMFVSTGPILITTSRQVAVERFVHAVSALAVPIVLALVALLIDRYQKRKEKVLKDQEAQRNREQQQLDLKVDEERRTLERKLDVWKLIFPIIDGYIRKHYVLISRQMDLLLSELDRSPLNVRYVMAEVMVLRAAFDRMGDEVGGFSFPHGSAEGICSLLGNRLMEAWEDAAGDRRGFAVSARAVKPTDLASEADEKMKEMAKKDSSLKKFHGDFAMKIAALKNMEELKGLLLLTIQFLDFENNALWYPWWYTIPPTLPFSTISFENLGLGVGDKARLVELLAALHDEVPKECRA